MDIQKKLRAIEARLGKPKQVAKHKGEYGFLCPGKPGSGGCTSAPQGKVRLWVNLARDEFNCWHCGFKGGSLAALMVRNSPEQREYLGSRPPPGKPKPEEKLPPCTALPPGYVPFSRSESGVAAPYRNYLRSRGVSDHTMALYRMGYVDQGQMAGRVIVPSFDQFGALNFWSARSIHLNETIRYRLPQASKDVISNEHMVDWAKPVYLVEGIFDEVAIGPQAIALYGKFMPPSLALRLVQRRPPMVYVCLDSDAYVEALELVHRLVGYDLTCSLVDLEDKDPAVAGSQAVSEAAALSQRVTGSAGLVGMRL